MHNFISEKGKPTALKVSWIISFEEEEARCMNMQVKGVLLRDFECIVFKIVRNPIM